MPVNLVLFPGSYPFSGAAEQTFVGPELPHLVGAFDRVVVVPCAVDGVREAVTARVDVDEDYARDIRPTRLGASTVRHAVVSGLVPEEVALRPRTLLEPRTFGKLLRWAGNAARTDRWLSRFMARHGLEARDTVFYTYWLTTTTLGVARFARRHGGVVVSRAHGGDLYHERHSPPHIPGQLATLRALNVLFLASEHARRYITTRFPSVTQRTDVAYLGVPIPPGVNAPSTDGVGRIVSCAFLTPVKRMDLLVHAVAELARGRSQRSFEWTHFGGGPAETALRELGGRLAPPNLRMTWRGTVDPSVIRGFYASTPVDVFVTTSSSEGGVPVSIMEAQSFGIPVVGTAVGGIPEIVSGATGALLPGHPSSTDVATALASVLDGGARQSRMRRESRRQCEEKFDAARNHARFAERLRALLRPASRGGSATA